MEIQVEGQFQHNGNLGARLGCWSWGENLAYNGGYSDPVGQLITQWANSPLHLAVMVGDWTAIGSASYYDANTGRTWFVSLFMRPCPDDPNVVPAQPPLPGPLPDAGTAAAPIDLAVLGGALVILAGLLIWLWRNKE
jgi:hypothetical protein